MTIKLYRDDSAKSIFIEDANGAQFTNSLQAIKNSDNSISVTDLARDIEIVSSESYDQFIDENDAQYGNDSDSVVNALNSEFAASGTPTNNVPVITSSLTASLTQGQTLNYELTTNFGVGYEWDLSNVAGITTVEGNNRKLIGGSSLANGTYNIPVKAINYNGEDSETLVLTVSAPPFSNTKSVKFNNNDYLTANAALVDNCLGRSAGSSGSGDAWSISCWFKAGTSANSEQTIVMFGGSDQDNEGRVQLWYDGSTGDKHLRLRYGTNNNYLEFETPNNSIAAGTWYHVLVTYDGGTTGQSQSQLSNYYSRFNIFIDGSNQSLTNSHGNYGWSGSIPNELFTVGRNGNTNNFLRNNSHVDELAVWNSDQSGNVSDIYNSGTPFDLTTLTTQPEHWWRMGDGDTFPTLSDSIASADFTMTNMTAADIVSDTP